MRNGRGTFNVYVKMLAVADGYLRCYRDDLLKHDHRGLEDLADSGGDEFLWALREAGTHFLARLYIRAPKPHEEMLKSASTLRWFKAISRAWEGRARWFLGSISDGSLRELNAEQGESKARAWDRAVKGGAV